MLCLTHTGGTISSYSDARDSFASCNSRLSNLLSQEIMDNSVQPELLSPSWQIGGEMEELRCNQRREIVGGHAFLIVPADNQHPEDIVFLGRQNSRDGEFSNSAGISSRSGEKINSQYDDESTWTSVPPSVSAAIKSRLLHVYVRTLTSHRRIETIYGDSLPFEPNQIIQVDRFDASGLASGKLLATNEQGWFPLKLCEAYTLSTIRPLLRANFLLNATIQNYRSWHYSPVIAYFVRNAYGFLVPVSEN